MAAGSSVVTTTFEYGYTRRDGTFTQGVLCSTEDKRAFTVERVAGSATADISEASLRGRVVDLTRNPDTRVVTARFAAVEYMSSFFPYSDEWRYWWNDDARKTVTHQRQAQQEFTVRTPGDGARTVHYARFCEVIISLTTKYVQAETAARMETLRGGVVGDDAALEAEFGRELDALASQA